MNSPRKQRVVIFRDKLLPWSEGFVLTQGESLRRFEAFYVGSRRAEGHLVPDCRSFLINEGTPLGLVREAMFKFWGRAPALRKFMATLKPVLVHAHYGIDCALIIPIVSSLNLPMVVTYHGYDATTKEEYARKQFYAFRKYVLQKGNLKREVKLFIAVSDFIKNNLIQQGFPQERVVRHYIGVDLTKFAPDLNVKRERMVLFVGRLSEEKGCEFVIRAVAKVQVCMPDVGLVMIGDGPRRERLEVLAEQLGCKCEFVGRKSQAEVRAWMNRATVLAAPSITVETGQCEGFGLVCAEAQAMGLPVVGFSTGGIPECVAHGETGFLAPERSWEMVADYIMFLFRDRLMWRNFSNNGQARVRKMFNLEQQEMKLENLYAHVVRQWDTRSLVF